MILIAGASGNIGRELVAQMNENGTAARALVRDASKHADLESALVEVVEGDLSQPASLQNALSGCERAFLVSSMDENQVELQGNFIEACQHAGIEYVVKVSSLGANPRSPVTVSKWHGETEKQMQDSGMKWTHLRPAYFMQNALSWAENIKRDSSFAWPLGEAKVSWIHARDIASVAHRVLESDDYFGQTLNVTGGEVLSGIETAQVFSEVLGREIRAVHVSLDEYHASLLSAGVPVAVADALKQLHGVLAQGHGAIVTDAVEKTTTRKPLTFAQFVQENAARF